MPAPSVIVIGLDPERVIPPPSIDANDLKAALDTSSKDVRDAGYYLKEIWVTTDDAIGRLQKALKEREWDTVVVGGGLHYNNDLNELFEEVVNMVHYALPGKPITFNRAPDRILEAVKRTCPI